MFRSFLSLLLFFIYTSVTVAGVGFVFAGVLAVFIVLAKETTRRAAVLLAVILCITEPALDFVFQQLSVSFVPLRLVKRRLFARHNFHSFRSLFDIGIQQLPDGNFQPVRKPREFVKCELSRVFAFSVICAS